MYPHWNTIFVFVWLSYLIGNVVFSEGGMTESQRSEVEILRSELNKAFDEHENAALEKKGVILQPSWTKGTSTALLQDANVEVTKKDLDEVKALRAELNYAVSHGDYVSSVAQTAAGNEASIRKLDQQLQMKAKGQGLLVGLTGAATSNESEVVGAMNAGENRDEHEGTVEGGGPNIVMANAHDDHIDVRKLQRLEVKKRRTKELLILESIEEDFSFDLGNDVLEWEHMVHGGEEYFIGRRKDDLMIVQKRAAKYQSSHVLPVGQQINALETYSYWNHEQQQQEGVLLVAIDNRVLWYRRSNTTNRIELYWTWVVGYPISGLTYFSSESKDYLAVPSNQSSRAGHYALSIYQFDLAAKEFWIAQRLQLQHPSDEVSLLDTGRDLVLAVAQNNSADIYTFNPRSDDTTDHIRFRLLRSIASEGIDHVSAFQMGGRNYLALGGLQPQILLYQQGDFSPRTILGSNFGRVELFVPVPVRTYRDDLLLFVQHRVDFESHTLTIVETLVWDGEAFVASIPVPCRLGEHKLHGASCMLDLQRDEGLKGAAVFRQGDSVALIVPRHDAESGLFRLHTQLLAKNSELLDLREIFAFLQEWVREQDELVAAAQRYLNTSDAQLLDVTPDLSTLEQLRVPALQFEGEIGEIYINDYQWTDGDSKTELRDVMAAIEQLEADMSANEHRNKRSTLDATADNLVGALDVQDVEIEELEFEEINGGQFYIHNGHLELPGTLQLYKLDVTAEEQVGDREARGLNAGVSNSESLTLEGDIEFEEINGVRWQELRANVVMLNEAQQLPMLRVEGDVVVAQQMRVDMVNGLLFPTDFLWTSGGLGRSTVVRAQKVFKGNLSANVIDTEGGLLNGVSTLDVITLNDAQHWTGEPTFAQLEVAERFELNGTAYGRDMAALPTNPTLQEANVVAAECHFKHLHVLGPVRLSGEFDGAQLGVLLDDVAQRPTDPGQPLLVGGAKHFGSIALPTDVELADARISGIPLEQFVTLHTPQRLNISGFANANVYFQQMQLDAGHTFDGVDIEELVRTAIRLDAPVAAPTTQLNFVGGIEAPLLEVSGALNGVEIAGNFQRTDEPIELHAARFEHLDATAINVLHNVLDTAGSGGPEALLNGVNLRAFMQRRDWLVPSAELEQAHVYIEELQLSPGSGLVVDEFHGMPAEYVLHFLENVDELNEMVLDGIVQVDHIAVGGDVQLHYLNGQRFDEDVQLTAVWLNRPNYLSTSMHFEQAPLVNGPLRLQGDYNGQPLDALIEDMVWRSDASDSNGKPIVITAPKSFERDVTVVEALQLQALNGVPFERIATKRRPLVVEGTLRLRGNAVVRDLSVAGHLNGFNTSELSCRVRYDEQLRAFVLLGTRALSGHHRLDDLTVGGDLNGLVPQLQRWFDRLVHKRDAQRLDGNYTFTGRVIVEGGLYARTLNEIDVARLLGDVVMVQPQPAAVRIGGLVRYSSGASSRAGEVRVSGVLQAQDIAGCPVARWLNDTLRVDVPQRIGGRVRCGASSLHANDLLVAQLNGIDLSQVVTLHTPQNLSGQLLFSALHVDEAIGVGGAVNGVADLQQEYDGALMLNPAAPQHVRTPLQLQGARVSGDLQTAGPVNQARQLRDVATLHGAQEFESPLYFQALHIREGHGVYTNDLISGIDLDQWQREALWARKRPRQWINGNWSVQQLTMRARDGNAIAEPPPPPRAARSSERLCQHALELWRRQRERPYALKYLERRFTLELGSTGNATVRAFAVANGATGEDLLLVNAGCRTRVYQWHGRQQNYGRLCEANAGAWLKVLPLRHGQFVALSDSAVGCNVTGSLHAWQLKAHDCIGHVRRYGGLDGVQDVGQFKHRPSYFYAVGNGTLFEVHSAGNATGGERQWSVAPHSQRRLYFVPHPTDLVLTNGEQFYWLRDATEPARGVGDGADVSTTLLRAVDGVEREMTFVDFEGILVRMLQDLVNRLDEHVHAVAQSSTPPSNVPDVHLQRDFIDVVAELRRQRLFPPDMFAGVSADQLRVPGSAAQALVAHVVLEAWPFVVELQELHQQLREDATAAQQLCACITGNLGLLMRDVLLLANRHSILQRVGQFRTYAMELASNLQADVGGRDNRKLLQAQGHSAPTQYPPGASGTEFDSRIFPARGQGEMLRVTVAGGGNSEQPLDLLAVTKVGDSPYSIRLYVAAHAAQLFQTLHTRRQARAMATLRVRKDTLLAYVEGCCTVHVLIHRDAQGFMPFARFEVAPPVLQLITLNVPADDASDGVTCRRFYVGVVQREAIVFYELLLTGEIVEFASTNCN